MKPAAMKADTRGHKTICGSHSKYFKIDPVMTC